MADFTTEEAIRRLVALLAPGPINLNTLVRHGIAGHIHANFDRVQGAGHPRQHVDTNNPDKRKPRIVRPGAIILPNLDIDENPANPRVRRRYSEADSLADAVVNEYRDHEDVTFFSLAEPAIVQGNATKVTLRVDPADVQRIRIWHVPAAAGGNLRHATVQEVIGPNTGNHEHDVQNTAGGAVAPGWSDQFIVEARTMLGDPRPGFAPPAAPPPSPPGPSRPPVPDTSGGSEAAPVVNATDTTQPVYAGGARDPGDIWIEVLHERVGVFQPQLKDVGLFTIAPWIMTWNTLPCQRVYVALIESASRGGGGPVTFADGLYPENHSMVYELKEGCHAAGLVPGAMPASHVRIARSSGTNIHQENDVQFYVIRERDPSDDRWVQDEFEIGYCSAPHHHIHIVLHTPRRGNAAPLGRFVRRYMAHPGMGVFDAVSSTAVAAGHNAPINFGGNLEVSPPVLAATPAIRRDAGGPNIRAHRRAPFGKILLGDCSPTQAGPELRAFLRAQRVQPVLAIDTSWLAVGHVDEMLTFVRATGAGGFKLLMARVRLMTLLLQAVRHADPGATIHAGKYWAPPGHNYMETSVEDWIGRDGGGGSNARRIFSERVEREKLSKIRARLKVGLNISEEQILSIPTYWENLHNPLLLGEGYQGSITIAENVGMVNMLVVNEHLMVPRPHGPRLPPAAAQEVVERVLERWFGYANAPSVADPASLDPHTFWARPGETTEKIALYFARPPAAVHGATNRLVWRGQLIQRIRGLAAPPLTAEQQGVVTPLNFHITGQNPVVPAHTFQDWRRVTINDGTVDVIELYMKSILEDIGNKVHFVENYESYHAMEGEVHCGTNAKREPPEQDAAFTDRWWDPGVYDPSYDTSYNPAI